MGHGVFPSSRTNPDPGFVLKKCPYNILMLRFLYIIKNVKIIYQNETGTWGIFLMTVD